MVTMYQAARQTTAFLYLSPLSLVSLVSTLISTVTTLLLIYSLFSFILYFVLESVFRSTTTKKTIDSNFHRSNAYYFFSFSLFLRLFFHYAFTIFLLSSYIHHAFTSCTRIMCRMFILHALN